MSDAAMQNLLDRLRTVLAAEGAADVPDDQLLQRFVATRDEAAFAAILQRHGPMVLGVCRRVLRHSHDAEDACQATFIVLARRAAAIRKHAALGSWLYKAAYRVARDLRAALHRRRTQPWPAADVAEPNPTDDVTWREVQAVLDEELRRLPDRFRAPLLLCCLEGKSRDEAAVQLGWSQDTVRGRLERGRRLLRRRLARRGLALSALFLAGSAPPAAIALPAPLMVSTIQAALLGAAGKAVAGLVSARVAALVEGVMHAMFVRKLMLTTALLVPVLIVSTGAVALARAALVAAPADGPVAGVALQQPNEPKQPAGKPSRGKTIPAGVPVELTIKVNKDTYALDLGGRTAAEFRKLLETADPAPEPPAVDLELQLRNTGDKQITVLVGGDETLVLMHLKGPGAATAGSMLKFTEEFRQSKRVTLAPGKSSIIPLRRLAFGHRMAAKYAYWLEPGDYTLTVEYRTAVSPPPPNTKEQPENFGQVTAFSAPVKLKVVAK